MTKYSIVIELDCPYESDVVCNDILRKMERNVDYALRNYLAQDELTVVHLEASKGSLQEAFGVGLEKP